VSLRQAQTSAAAGLTWVIVGDLAKIEAPVRALKLGDTQVLDVDGQIVARP